MKLRTIIVEDEINNQELLCKLLNDYCSDIEVIGIGSSVSESIELIKANEPDLVFLDVEIIEGTGFDVLRGLSNISFKIIFVTGYEHYAIKAIKYSAIDYILKPIDIEELQTAIHKARITTVSQKENVEYLQNHLSDESNYIQSIVLSTLHSSDTVDINNIAYVEAEEKGCKFIMRDGNNRYSALKFSFFENLLDPSIFVKIHRSVIINCNTVISHDNERSITVLMSGDVSLKVAYRRKSRFLEAMSLRAN